MLFNIFFGIMALFGISSLIYQPVYLFYKIANSFRFDEYSDDELSAKAFKVAIVLSIIPFLLVVRWSYFEGDSTSSSTAQFSHSEYKTYAPKPTLSTYPTFDYDFDFELPAAESTKPKFYLPDTSNSTPIVFVTYPTSVYPGTRATVKIKGEPYTTYDITVRYSSGPSRAAGLEPKQSNAEGYVMWSWKIGTNTYAGSYPIIVSGGGSEKTIHFEVLS